MSHGCMSHVCMCECIEGMCVFLDGVYMCVLCVCDCLEGTSVNGMCMYVHRVCGV